MRSAQIIGLARISRLILGSYQSRFIPMIVLGHGDPIRSIRTDEYTERFNDETRRRLTMVSYLNVQDDHGVLLD